MKGSSRLSRILSRNVILSAALPILIVGLLTIYIISINLTEEITSKNLSLSRSIAGEVERFLSEPVSLLGQISNLIENNIVKDNKEINAYLKTATDNYRFLDMIQILDKDGIIRYSSPLNPDVIGKDMSYQPYYHETLALQKAIPVELPYWSPAFISDQTNEPTLSISKVMKTGMVVGFLDLDILNTITSRLKPGKGHAIIVDRDGTVISHHNKQYVRQRVNLKDHESVRIGLAGNEGTVRETSENKETLSSVTIVPQNGWLVIFQQDVDEAFAAANKVKSIFIIGIVATLGIAVIIAILSIQRTLTPLAQLITNIKSVASGNYASNPVEKSYQEIDELADNFDTMMWEVKSREEALLKSEEKYRMLVEKMTDGITILDADGIHIFVNDRFCDMLGYQPSEIIGRKATDFVDPVNREVLEKQLVERRKGKLDPYELTYTRKDGSALPALVSPSAMFDNEGTFTGSFGVITEITDLKQTQDDLRMSEERFRSITDSSPMGIHMYELKEDGRLIFIGANPAADAILGVDNSQFIGKTIEESFPTIVGNEVPDRYREVAENGGTWHTELMNYEDEQISGIFEVHAFQTSPNRMAALFMDISERKKTEATLNKEREFTEKAIDAQMDTFFVFDPDTGKAVRWNQRFREISGYTDDEIAGMKAPDSYYSPEDRENVKAIMEEIIKTGQGKVEITLICKDGTRIPTEYYASTITDEEENRRYIISVGRDVTKRRQADEALLESEERFRALFDNSTDGILLANIETKQFVTGNKAIFGMTGFSSEELVGMSVTDIHPEEDLPYVIDQFDRQAKREIMLVRDIPVRRKDGSIFYADINSFPITLGKQHLLAGFFRDVTEQRKAEEVLKESEERLRLISEASFEGIVITENGRVLDINQQLTDMLGYSVSEMLGKKVIDFVAPESRDIVSKNIKENRDDKYEHLALKKDGSRITVEVRGKNITYKGKSVRLTSIRDITERKLSEEALRESEERFRELADLLPESIFEVNTDNIVTYANRNAFDQFGYTDEDFKKGINAIDLLAPEDRKRATDNTIRILNGENIGISEYTAERKDGTRFPAMIRSAAVVRHGKPVGLRGFMIDMTEQKRLEGQLRQTQKMEAIGTLAGGIAHDFNNILTAIIGYAEILKRKLPDDSPGISALDNILDAGERASGLVKQILAFSRRDEAQYAPMLIEPIVKEVLKLIRSTIPATIELHQQINQVGMVIADPTQLHQIIMNLCTNAYHAMHDTGGKIEVALDEISLDADQSTQYHDLEPGRYVQLTVKDTGHGIDPSIIDRIFDPYFTTKEKGKGTGLGLSVVHGIVKSFGGSIRVHSELSKGTDVHVLLPVAEADTSIEERTDTELPRGNETVLFVDDEESLTILCRELLEVLGYEVVTKTRAVDALELFRTDPGKYDLVITDMTMPGMTGLTLSKELLAIRPDTPIVLCTGYSEELNEENVKRKGIKAYLMKPFSSGNLSRLIRSVLDGKRTPSSQGEN